MKLFEPGNIGSMTVKNRIVMAAIGTGRMTEADGRWGNRIKEYYVARARGGVGLITTELVFVTRQFEPFASLHLDLYSDSHLESLRQSVREIHQYGTRVSVQLTAGFGRVMRPRWQAGTVPVSASEVPCYFNTEVTTRALSTEEAQVLAEAFGAAAKRCQMAEADAVELHGHEGYILDQFMSAIWNRRADKYGGSREKRLTFAREAISAIKREAGEDFPVIYRYGVNHYFEGGRTPEESVWIAGQLEEMGVDALHADAGCYETWWWPHPPAYQPPGCMVDMAQMVKHAVRIPVIAVGKLNYPALAEQVLQEGKADFIAIGRGLLADPEWANKVREGRYEDITPCIGDHEGCSGELRQGRATSCTVNPACGHEKEWALTPAKNKKSVLIIGGGPAGMEAARVAAARGMDVTLWEKTDRLGGNLLPASAPEFKKDLRDLVSYQVAQVRKLPVKLEFNREATVEAIIRFGADSVILATGARSVPPDIPGLDTRRAITAVDLLSAGVDTGMSVIVIGGGLIGCETAVYLAQQGRRVTLTTRRGKLLTDMIEQNRLMLLKMMADSNVQVLTDTTPVRIVRDGILVSRDNEEQILMADSLVFAGGMKSCHELQSSLTGRVPRLHPIGDCVQPRHVIHAIWEAFHTARKLGTEDDTGADAPERS